MVNNHYMESSNSTPLTMLEAGSLAYRFGVVCRLVRDELLPELDPPIYQGFLTIFATTYILLPLARADEDLLSYLPPILVEAYEYRRVEMDGYVYTFPERPVSDDMLDMGILFVALCWGIEKGDNPFSHLNYLFCSSEQIGSSIKKGFDLFDDGSGYVSAARAAIGMCEADRKSALNSIMAKLLAIKQAISRKN